MQQDRVTKDAPSSPILVISGERNNAHSVYSSVAFSPLQYNSFSVISHGFSIKPCRPFPGGRWGCGCRAACGGLWQLGPLGWGYPKKGIARGLQGWRLQAGGDRLEATGLRLQAGMLDVSHARASRSSADFGPAQNYSTKTMFKWSQPVRKGMP